MRFGPAFSLVALAALAVTPAAAQRRPPTPEQRIERLEKQVRQVQKQVFPKGQPADTAGFSDDPAATQDSVNSIGSRLDGVERQMADLVRLSEENGNRVATLEAELARLRADSDQRLRTLETGGANNAPDTTESTDQSEAEPAPPPSRPKVETAEAASPPLDKDAAAEAAYDKGYQLWNAGKYDQAITALKAMAKSYPDHRRVSWAHNLEGRALLDKGQARAAAEVLLANYRRDPKGERAQDSLYYLGQSLVKLGQPGQACKAYQELEEVYGSSLRAQLKSSLPSAKAAARCG
jgi:TolA-binding protein